MAEFLSFERFRLNGKRSKGRPILIYDSLGCRAVDMRRSYSEQANQFMRAVDNTVAAGFGW